MLSKEEEANREKKKNRPRKSGRGVRGSQIP